MLPRKPTAGDGWEDQASVQQRIASRRVLLHPLKLSADPYNPSWKKTRLRTRSEETCNDSRFPQEAQAPEMESREEKWKRSMEALTNDEYEGC